MRCAAIVRMPLVSSRRRWRSNAISNWGTASQEAARSASAAELMTRASATGRQCWRRACGRAPPRRAGLISGQRGVAGHTGWSISGGNSWLAAQMARGAGSLRLEMSTLSGVAAGGADVRTADRRTCPPDQQCRYIRSELRLDLSGTVVIPFRLRESDSLSKRQHYGGSRGKHFQHR